MLYDKENNKANNKGNNNEIKKEDSNFSKGEVAKIILKTLLAGVLIVTVLALPGIGVIGALFPGVNKRDRKKISRAFNQLQKQKLVSIVQKGGKTIIRITKKGNSRVLKFDFDDMQIKKTKVWDQHWRIITFDIPTHKNYQRDLLRLKLQELGFHMVQKSMFIHPYAAKDEIDFIGEYLGIRKFITYILARKIEGGIDFQKFFKLTK